MKIVLFEDTQVEAAKLLAALRGVVGAKDVIERFESVAGDPEKTYEERLRIELSNEKYCDATLIVADRDLSKTSNYTGLSESVVRRVADQLATPECFYARNATDVQVIRAEEREAFIAVSIDDGPDECAKRVFAVAQGFDEIRSKLVGGLIANKQLAGKTLASLLGKVEYADKIALYASGDRNRPGHVLNMAQDKKPEQLNRLVCLFGYWLWDSVLQYPGVVVNEVAAASYLNIRTEEFKNDPAIQKMFADARYTGPFAAAKKPLWWRGMLDDMVAKELLTDGNALAAKRLQRAVPRSECCENRSIPAGYYCMLSGEPVSLQNSRPGLAWFPRGADLARVSKSRYDELGPWL